MSSPRNIDLYDGHVLVTEAEGDDLVHYIEHPLTCEMVQHGDVSLFACVPEMHATECGEWPEATSPGVRVVGWRHDEIYCGLGQVEHDVVAFTVGDPLPVEWNEYGNLTFRGAA